MNQQDLYNLLRKCKFKFNDEKTTQAQIEQVLISSGVCFEREKKLNEKDIPDFMVGNIAIEVKIGGSKSSIYNQCKRYLLNDSVNTVLLLTSKPVGNLNTGLSSGKRILTLDTNLAWL